MIRVEFQGFRKIWYRLVDTTLIHQDRAQSIVSIRESGVAFYRDLEMNDGLVQIPLLDQRHAHCVLRVNVQRRAVWNSGELGNGFTELPFCCQGITHQVISEIVLLSHVISMLE